MDPGIVIGLALVALAVGAIIGWLVGNRAAAAATERAARAPELQKLLDAVTAERDEAMRARAALEADARNFDARMSEIREAKEVLSAQSEQLRTHCVMSIFSAAQASAHDRHILAQYIA